MARQDNLPPIWGKGWNPAVHLEFSTPLKVSDARQKMMLEVAQQLDGHLRVFAFIWDEMTSEVKQWDGEEFHAFADEIVTETVANLGRRGSEKLTSDIAADEIIPRRSAALHLERRAARFAIDLRLALRRIAHQQSVTVEQRMKWQRWMTRTRNLDENLKILFMDGLETPDGGKFGGKGFRSTWQEGIVACASALNRAIDLPVGMRHSGDVVAPMIRDVGLALAMGQTPTEIFAAQTGKSTSLMNGGHSDAGGRDLHIGNWPLGILPPTAPLPIASATTTGIALASQRLEMNRFHLAPVGEGCSSSGEFWEAMNFAGARGLPICYMIQNNQIALDTFTAHQNNAELWADKGRAVGLPSWTIDGSDPAAFYASTATAREFALTGGGPTLIHVETMRGCGHAHHHDDLYLGAKSGNPPGYVDGDLLSYWEAKDPLPNHRTILKQLGVEEEALARMEQEEKGLVDSARSSLEEMIWPEGDSVTTGVTSIHDADSHANQLSRLTGEVNGDGQNATVPSGKVAIEFSSENTASTYSRAIQQGMVAIAERWGSRAVFMGEDMEIAGAFGMNLPLEAKGHGDLLLDMPLSESIIINAATGAALGGLRPMAEIQFGGFAALAMNPLINNAAQLRWRWGAEVPLVVRIPLGAKTRSGPFHANMIESWFANDPGLVILFPSTPQDAYDLLVEAASIPDPVIYLEHIGMYGLRGGLTGWGDNINQILDKDTVQDHLDSQSGCYKIGKAEVVRGGEDATIITYGAMTHVALKAAEILAEQGKQIEIIDLRTILPFDSTTCVNSVKRTGRYMVLQEAQYSGGFGHTISSRIQEEVFYFLEAAPVIVGALDTPVPFSPTLEDHTIPDVDLVVSHLQNLCSL
ncbi:MAG: thiamine pyrophosphate-dependent enzyme [Candidatus Thalassarchaeaceae archaeon]|nr:thiamine pyrophosphate-dependent enzyme [Candidatus Thalassarchaeaceae archaeon]